jgi:hypothetical protein
MFFRGMVFSACTKIPGESLANANRLRHQCTIEPINVVEINGSLNAHIAIGKFAGWSDAQENAIAALQHPRHGWDRQQATD